MSCPITCTPVIGRKHPSRDVIFSGQNLAQKMPKIITSHDILEPLKQVLSTSRDVIISGQICGSKLQKAFPFGDGCWLPMLHKRIVPSYLCNHFGPHSRHGGRQELILWCRQLFGHSCVCTWSAKVKCTAKRMGGEGLEKDKGATGVGATAMRGSERFWNL